MKAQKKINFELACALLFAAILLQACGASSEQAARERQQTAAAPRRDQSPTTAHIAPQAAHGNGESETAAATDSHEGHSHGAPGPVPRFAAAAAELKNLPPALPASQFTGLTTMAYAAVKEIPQTIAQLPCYCNCD